MQTRTAGLTFQRARSPDVDIVSCRSWLPLVREESTVLLNPYLFSVVLNRVQVI
jgi:hypothetical protein